MTVGDKVRVWPYAHREKTAVGTLMIASSNEHSIGIAFGEDYVPFITAATGMAIHPEHGKMLLLSWETQLGFWRHVLDGGYFEIEVAPVGEKA